jgi:hypothetical protein
MEHVVNKYLYKKYTHTHIHTHIHTYIHTYIQPKREQLYNYYPSLKVVCDPLYVRINC